ncbi:hypothetical protein GLOIN_2v1766278 [Rhizophagus irregularis DAOM 181602=DAOM 197198]|nr:hypothetical protein GLOIN_2v1766278 [Rhizophagus irregularis DAOM 181602=DAOM 197198]
MTGSGDAKRLIIHFHTAEARDCVKGAKMQQARIVYDHADAISRFTTQWAVYCFSTCLRVTPCHYSLEQKAARRAFVAVLSGLPANTKNIHLAPLVKEHGAKAINIPLSLNSYKPKPWAYVTFNSQETMDAAMEQTIGFQGRTLRWVHPTIRKLFATVVNASILAKDRSVSFSSNARAPLPIQILLVPLRLLSTFSMF